MPSIAIFNIVTETPWLVHLNTYDLPYGALPVAASATVVVTGLATGTSVQSAVYDAAGDLYALAVTAGAVGSVLKFSGGAQTTVISGIAAVAEGLSTCLAIDAALNIYVVLQSGAVSKYAAPTYTTVTEFAPALLGVFSIAFDGNGTALIAMGTDFVTWSMYTISLAGVVNTLNANAVDPSADGIGGIVFDNSGNIYVSYDEGFGATSFIASFTASGASINPTVSTFDVAGDVNQPFGFAFDPVAQQMFCLVDAESSFNTGKSYVVTLAGAQTQFASTASGFGALAMAGPLPLPVITTRSQSVAGSFVGVAGAGGILGGTK